MFTPSPLGLFCSYSHKDETLLQEFSAALASVRRRKWVDVWTDRRIRAGDDFAGEIDVKLETATIIVLMVSADFLNSDYCYTKEMTRAMERHAANQATVIPVIVRACDWTETPFAKLMAIPKDGKPVTSWTNRDEAWTDVAIEIKKVLQARYERMSEAIANIASYGPAVAASYGLKAGEIASQIAEDARRQQAERHRIMADLATKISAIKDSGGVMKRRTDEAFKAMDAYLGPEGKDTD